MGGRAFLIEGLALGTVDEALENQRAIANSSESARGDGEIVAYEIKFGELGLLGKIRFIRMGYTDFATLDRQNLGFVVFHHRISATLTIAAKLFTA